MISEIQALPILMNARDEVSKLKYSRSFSSIFVSSYFQDDRGGDGERRQESEMLKLRATNINFEKIKLIM